MNSIHYFDRFKSILITLLVAPIAIILGDSFFSETGNWWETQVANIGLLVLVLVIGSAVATNIRFKELLFTLGVLSLFRLVAELLLNYADYFKGNQGAYGVRKAEFTIHTTVYLLMCVLALTIGIYFTFRKNDLRNRYLLGTLRKIRNSQRRFPVLIAVLLSIISFIVSIYGIFLQGYNFRSNEQDIGHYTNLFFQLVVLVITTLVVLEYIVDFLEVHLDELKRILIDLNDTSIDKYITRRLSSWLYSILRFTIIVGCVVAAPYVLRSILVGDFPLYYLTGLSLTTVWWIIGLGSIVLMPIALVFAYIMILLIRFVLEYSNAIIHIAQNTSK